MSNKLARIGRVLIPGVLLFAACADSTGGRPEADKTIRVSYTSVLEFDDLPSLLVERLLSEKGYRVVRTCYAQSELAVQALSRGDADLGYGATRTHWAAIAKGAPIISLAEQASGAWLIVAPVGFRDCYDLDNRRLGQHSEGSVGRAMMDAYMRARCPSIRPQLVTIPGSQNRAAALLGGLVDAAVLDVADMVAIDRRAPGGFRPLVDLCREFPNVHTTGLQVNRSFMRRHPDAVRDYVRATLLAHRQIAEDPGAIRDLAVQQLHLEPELVSAIIDTYRDRMVWKTDGGFTAESIRATLRFFIESGSLDSRLTPEQVADLGPLQQALVDLGRSGPGAGLDRNQEKP